VLVLYNSEHLARHAKAFAMDERRAYRLPLAPRLPLHESSHLVSEAAR
jgi:hypothetical protein